jgi:hypothetical protein
MFHLFISRSGDSDGFPRFWCIANLCPGRRNSQTVSPRPVNHNPSITPSITPKHTRCKKMARSLNRVTVSCCLDLQHNYCVMVPLRTGPTGCRARSVGFCQIFYRNFQCEDFCSCLFWLLGLISQPLLRFYAVLGALPLLKCALRYKSA